MFKSKKERRLWIWVVLITTTIYSTIIFGRPLAKYFQDQNVQAIFFVAVLLLITLAVVIHAFASKPGRVELALWIGLAAVYSMFILRLGLAERSHLIEYSILSIFIFRAFYERYEGKVLKSAFFAFIMSVMVGVLDECIQIFAPHRVFDTTDIVFNTMAVFFALGSVLLMFLVRKWRKTDF